MITHFVGSMQKYKEDIPEINRNKFCRFHVMNQLNKKYILNIIFFVALPTENL